MNKSAKEKVIKFIKSLDLSIQILEIELIGWKIYGITILRICSRSLFMIYANEWLWIDLFFIRILEGYEIKNQTK